MFGWLKRYRRRRWWSEEFPPEWVEHLQDGVRLYGYLHDDQVPVLHRAVQVLYHEKHWEGCEGLQVNARIKVTICGNAALMLLGTGDAYFFDRVRTILVYPHYIVRRKVQDGLLVYQQPQVLAGEAWHGGPVVLSWADVIADRDAAGQGYNVVIHELAHHLDSLDGDMHGTPPFTSRRDQIAWQQTAFEEFENLRETLDHGGYTVLDPYAASNEAEFFAVACEMFFERPLDLRLHHPELHDLLVRFFHFDPTEWFDER